MLRVRNLVSDYWSMNPDFMLENYTKMPLIHKTGTFDRVGSSRKSCKKEQGFWRMDRILACKDRKEAFYIGAWRTMCAVNWLMHRVLVRENWKKKAGKRGEGKLIIEWEAVK